MQEFFVHNGFWLIVVGLPTVGWILTDIVQKVMVNWRKARESEQLAALKQSLVDRNLSVDDIERIVNAGRTPRKGEEERETAAQRV